jgi:hypothetical protein
MLHELLNGGLAGLAATAPMNVVMRAGEGFVPRPWGGRLPPRQITDRLLNEAGVRSEMEEKQRAAAATAAHYGFGATAGSLLGAVASQTPPRFPRPVLGMGVGLAVWAASYGGWLPLAGIRQPATAEPKERNAQMIAAHLVWGCVAGGIVSALERAQDSWR